MEMLMADADPLPEIACFHAQQCVEKYLKAFLTAHDRHVEEKHTIYRIFFQCAARLNRASNSGKGYAPNSIPLP